MKVKQLIHVFFPLIYLDIIFISSFAPALYPFSYAPCISDWTLDFSLLTLPPFSNYISSHKDCVVVILIYRWHCVLHITPETNSKNNIIFFISYPLIFWKYNTCCSFSITSIPFGILAIFICKISQLLSYNSLPILTLYLLLCQVFKSDCISSFIIKGFKNLPNILNMLLLQFYPSHLEHDFFNFYYIRCFSLQ